MKFRAEATLVWHFEAETQTAASVLFCEALADIEAANGDEYQGYSNSEIEELPECKSTPS